jgi:hypothetical protein
VTLCSHIHPTRPKVHLEFLHGLTQQTLHPESVLSHEIGWETSQWKTSAIDPITADHIVDNGGCYSIRASCIYIANFEREGIERSLSVLRNVSNDVEVKTTPWSLDFQ